MNLILPEAFDAEDGKIVPLTFGFQHNRPVGWATLHKVDGRVEAHLEIDSELMTDDECRALFGHPDNWSVSVDVDTNEVRELSGLPLMIVPEGRRFIRSETPDDQT